MYYITFEGTEGGKKKEYEAKIWVKESENFKKVVGFKLVGDDRAMLHVEREPPVWFMGADEDHGLRGGDCVAQLKPDVGVWF